jgi:hypothetical protein
MVVLHGSECNSNGGNLCWLRAARVTVVGASRSRDQDATGSVDQRLGTGGDVCTVDLCGAPNMMVHVAMLV